AKKAAPAKKAAAKKAPAKKATAKKAAGKKDEAAAGVDVDATDEDALNPPENLEDAEIDLADADLDVEDETPAKTTKGKTSGAKGKKDEKADDSEKSSSDFVWDEEESEALRQARKDAELTASADSVRAYLKQIGKVALLNAEEEVELAKRIEAGLYAAERLRIAEEEGEKLSTQMRRDLKWIVRDGERAKSHLLEANLRLVVSLAKRYTGR